MAGSWRNWIKLIAGDPRPGNRRRPLLRLCSSRGPSPGGDTTIRPILERACGVHEKATAPWFGLVRQRRLMVFLKMGKCRSGLANLGDRNACPYCCESRTCAVELGSRLLGASPRYLDETRCSPD